MFRTLPEGQFEPVTDQSRFDDLSTDRRVDVDFDTDGQPCVT